MRYPHALHTLQAACCLAFLAATAVYGQPAVKGKAIFKGTPAKLRPISMDADAVCAKKHSGPVLPETSVIKADGSLKNVFVYVSKGLEGKKFPTPSTPVVLDQSGCEYVPHVFGIMANQQLKVVNSDATTHNVHAMGQVNQEFNVGQRAGAPPVVKTFPKPEVTIPILCNQHPWMRAVAHVVSNPYYAVTDENGAFSLKGLPPGKYTITGIHEKYGTQSQEITVVAGKPVPAVNFTFSSGTASIPSPLKVLPAMVIE
ncbi:MAG TPA: carboxypeptidase regulatory-like domain-containing protein [Bryobacteraceae bacterium]|nr:carboxypeptidase regulatory-like domain-containing protein [Bryobacteraceae bacterium]